MKYHNLQPEFLHINNMILSPSLEKRNEMYFYPYAFKYTVKNLLYLKPVKLHRKGRFNS